MSTQQNTPFTMNKTSLCNIVSTLIVHMTEGTKSESRDIAGHHQRSQVDGRAMEALLNRHVFNLCLKDYRGTLFGCHQGAHSTKLKHQIPTRG